MSVIWTNLSFDDLIGDGVRGPKVAGYNRSFSLVGLEGE